MVFSKLFRAECILHIVQRQQKVAILHVLISTHLRSFLQDGFGLLLFKLLGGFSIVECCHSAGKSSSKHGWTF